MNKYSMIMQHDIDAISNGDLYACESEIMTTVETTIHTQVLVVGHTCMDMCMHVNHMPRTDHKAAATHMHMELGGNAARVMGVLQSQGVQSHLITILGSDSELLTQLTIQHLHAWPHLIHMVHAPATVSQVWCDAAHHRTIVSHQHELVTQAELPQMPGINAQVALFDNHRWPLVCQVRSALNPDCVQILDMDQIPHKKDLNKIKGFDQIWFSKEAYESLGMSLTSLSHMLQASVVGFTQGAQPVVWWEKGEIHTWMPPEVTHVNTTLGAGDAFRAGLVQGVLAGLSVQQCVKMACESAVNHIKIT